MKGKVAIITGSTSGIGLGIAKNLAQCGCNVVLNGLGNLDDIEQLRQSFETEYNVQALFHGADLTKPAEIADLVQKTIDKFSKVDILVNNAGIQHVAPIDEFPEDKWELIIRLNLIASFYTIKYVLPHMKKNNFGRIINIASAHGLVASPFKSAYVSAKHGILGLTKTVALEVAKQGITANSICPGYVKTPLVVAQITDTAKIRGISEEEVINNVMLGPQATKSFIEVDEVAKLVVYLCSDSAKSVTGAALSIDGGWTAQ